MHALVFRGREDLPVALAQVRACEREDTCRADQFFRQPPCKDAKVVVHLLLAFTKEQRRMSVMLGTSDLDFGARLARRMDIDSVHLHSIHIGEVEPAEMLTELTNEWGLGEDTAVAIADAYGGHVLAAMSAIEISMTFGWPTRCQACSCGTKALYRVP